LQGPDKDTIRSEQVCDGSSLSKELRVGEDVEAASGPRVGLEDGAHGLRCSAWHGGLLNDDLGGGSNLGDTAGREFNVAMYMIEIVSLTPSRGEIMDCGRRVSETTCAPAKGRHRE